MTVASNLLDRGKITSLCQPTRDQKKFGFGSNKLVFLPKLFKSWPIFISDTQICTGAVYRKLQTIFNQVYLQRCLILFYFRRKRAIIRNRLQKYTHPMMSQRSPVSPIIARRHSRHRAMYSLCVQGHVSPSRCFNIPFLEHAVRIQPISLILNSSFLGSNYSPLPPPPPSSFPSIPSLKTSWLSNAPYPFYAE